MTKEILRPSSAAKRFACPGSFRLEQQAGQKIETESASEGKLAHEAAALFLKDNKFFESEAASIYDEDMKLGANLYRSTILELCKRINVNNIERKLKIPLIHENCEGTPDYFDFIIDPDFGVSTLFIFDYKYGHRSIEAVENFQLIEYAAGILDILPREPNLITFVIVQPRDYVTEVAKKIWTINFENFNEYIEKLKKSESEAFGHLAKLSPSALCKFCDAAFVCPALQKECAAIIDFVREPPKIFHDKKSYAVELYLLRKTLEILESRILVLEQQVMQDLKNGESVPFFNLKQTPGRERWKTNIEEVLVMSKLLEIDVLKPAELVTPAQAVKKGMPRGIVDALSERKEGSLKLEEIDFNFTKSIFNVDGST